MMGPGWFNPPQHVLAVDDETPVVNFIYKLCLITLLFRLRH